MSISALLDDFYQVMDEKVMKIGCMVKIYLMMHELVLFGSKIKFLFSLVKLSQPRLALKNGFGIGPMLRSSTFIVTSMCLLLMFFKRIVLRSVNSC